MFIRVHSRFFCGFCTRKSRERLLGTMVSGKFSDNGGVYPFQVEVTTVLRNTLGASLKVVAQKRGDKTTKDLKVTGKKIYKGTGAEVSFPTFVTGKDTFTITREEHTEYLAFNSGLEFGKFQYVGGRRGWRMR